MPVELMNKLALSLLSFHFDEVIIVYIFTHLKDIVFNYCKLKTHKHTIIFSVQQNMKFWLNVYLSYSDCRSAFNYILQQYVMVYDVHVQPPPPPPPLSFCWHAMKYYVLLPKIMTMVYVMICQVR